jgi:hypothetical protein
MVSTNILLNIYLFLCRPPHTRFLWKPLMGVGAGRGLGPSPAASSLASVTTGPLNNYTTYGL